MNKEDLILDKINEYLNDNDDIITNNLELIYDINNRILEILSYYKDTYEDELKNVKKDLEMKLPIININQIFKIVDDYIKKYNIDINLEELIDKGIINFVDKYTNLQNKREENIEIDGICNHDKKLIEVNNNGSIIDSATLVHELSHYRDKFNNDIFFTRFLFTEALAISEELIMIDDYNEKVYLFLQHIYDLYRYSLEMHYTLKMILVYQKFGSISKEDYKLYYGDDLNYNHDYNILVNNYGKDVIKQFIQILKYTLQTLLAITLMYRNRSDNLYYEKIKEYHNQIDKLEVNEYLKLLEININNLDELYCNLDEFCNEELELLRQKEVLYETNKRIHN